MNTESDQDYYNQLHETLRLYQKELWGTPAIFLGLEGFIFLKILVDPLTSLLFKELILLLNVLIVIMVWVFFEKITDRSFKLQDQVDKFDIYFDDPTTPKPKKISMYKGEIKFENMVPRGLHATTLFRFIILIFLLFSLYSLISFHCFL